MSFHKKILIAYVSSNLILIVLGYLHLYAFEPTLATDQDLALNGVNKTVWPAISLFMTGLVVASSYALRCLWQLGVWAYRKVA